LRSQRLDGKDTVPTDLYFIQTDCAEGFIKIGVACDVKSRMRKLQTACPYKLSVIKIVKNAATMERELHLKFSGDRVTGEWFKRSPELLSLIESLQGYVEPVRETPDYGPIIRHPD